MVDKIILKKSCALNNLNFSVGLKVSLSNFISGAFSMTVNLVCPSEIQVMTKKGRTRLIDGACDLKVLILLASSLICSHLGSFEKFHVLCFFTIITE